MPDLTSNFSRNFEERQSKNFEKEKGTKVSSGGFETEHLCFSVDLDSRYSDFLKGESIFEIQEDL